MTTTFIIKLSRTFIALLLCSTMVNAENIQQKTLPLLAKALATIDNKQESNLSLISTSNVWSQPPLNVNLSSDSMTGEQETIEQLFLVDDIKTLQKQIDLRFKTGLYSLKNNYILSPYYSSLISYQLLRSETIDNDLYQFGRLSAETGYSRAEYFQKPNFKVYIRSAYSVLHKGRFDLSLTASVEHIQISKNHNNLAAIQQPLINSQSNVPATSATIGVIGSFDLSERWSLIGALTSSHIDNKNIHDILPQENKRHMALIGTTYSF